MPFVKDQHPRLYFGAEDLPTIRAKAKTGMRARAAGFVLRWADRLLDPASPHFFDYVDMKRDIWSKRSGFFTWRASLYYLTWAYVLTGERRYGQAARDALLNAIRLKLADKPFPAEGPTHSGWRRSPMHQHDKGNYAITICLVYDCCYDLFDEGQRKAFTDHAIESMEILLDPLVNARDRVFIFNNRGARAFVGCLGYYPMTLAGDVEDMRAPMVGAGERYLQMAWDGDGYPLEGWSYGSVLGEMHLFFRAAARGGWGDLRRMPVFHQCLNAMLYEVLPTGGACNNLNDCTAINGGARGFIGIMSRPEGAAVPWLLQKIDLHPDRLARCETDLIDAYYESPWLSAALFWDEDVPVKSPSELGYPLSACFPQAGVAAMRTGWDHDDYLLVHRAGLCVPQLHSQSDQNHLALYALGEKFLVDEGYGDRLVNWPADIPKPEPGRYFGQSQYHNTVLIDGKSQNGTIIEPGSSRGKLLGWLHTDAFDTSLGDAGACYTIDRVIDRALRRVVFVRGVPHPYYVIIDDVTVDATDRPHIYEVLWRTDDANRIDVAGMDFTIRGQQNDCLGHVLYNSSPATLSVRMQALRPQLRVQITAPAMQVVTVLCPLRRGSAAPQFTCLRRDDGDFTIEAADGRTRSLVTAGVRLTTPLRRPVPPCVDIRAS